MTNRRKPVIGILGLTRSTDPGLYISGEHVFTGSTNVRAIQMNGGVPVLIPAAMAAEDVEAAVSFCDGILIPGGDDVTPWYYDEEPLPVIGTFRPEIDDAWLKVGRYALENKIPMLGICKGHQTLNVLMGGSLYQDLSLQGGELIQHLQRFNRTYLTHHVEVVEGTRLAGLFGAGKLKTNSMHHQAVKKLGKGLKISARACDGTVEGIEDEEGLIMGVQWHPEDLVDSAPVMNRLFADLVERALRR
ncbi:MAG: gamma-glutamyl-gamma-aminobutyrate hydrolase family protein [Lachnospiraceae bacterium]|nr:gamma-glutamyl-gamma-aminobutyrate hydrolase family protein [Lachnospiraceae bacterium]